MAICGGTTGGSIINYIIHNTAGEAEFIIRQAGVNGPNESQKNTDLTLYGYKAPNWGEQFNENFYRLLENFATPSQRGAHSSISGGIDFSKAHNRPASEDDLDLPGFGINSPVDGQFWWNTSATKLYIYDAETDNWRLIGPCCVPDECGYGGSLECALIGDCGYGGSQECYEENPCFGYGGPIDPGCGGSGSGSLDVVYINDLIDVSTSGVANGQVLGYNGVTDVWYPITLPTLATVPTVISDMSDVNTIGASVNDVLTYTGSGWIAQAPSGGGGGGATVLSDLTDVNTFGAANGNTLIYNAGTWLPGIGPFDPSQNLTFLYNAATSPFDILINLASGNAVTPRTKWPVRYDTMDSVQNAQPSGYFFPASPPWYNFIVPPGISYWQFTASVRVAVDAADSYVGTLPYSVAEIGILKSGFGDFTVEASIATTSPWYTGTTQIFGEVPDAGSGLVSIMNFTTPWIPVTPGDIYYLYLNYIAPTAPIASLFLTVYKDGTHLTINQR